MEGVEVRELMVIVYCREYNLAESHGWNKRKSKFIMKMLVIFSQDVGKMDTFPR